MTYEELLIMADKEELIVKEKPLSGHDGRIKGKRIAIRKDIETSIEKSCILAEELGHYYTTCGNILHQGSVMNRRQERHARLFAHDLLIGLHGLIKAYEAGCENFAEIADFLDITEEFLLEALQYYKEKYGIYKVVDDYIVYFEPNFYVEKR